jgi:hypothetical protein
MNSREVVFLFGAGASYGSGDCKPHAPPLGTRLFDELEKQGGAFSALSESTKAFFRENGFEAGMASVPNHSTLINALQREVAIYLSKFAAPPHNAYSRLFRRLRSVMSSVVVATLNYDLLIEGSLQQSVGGFAYSTRGTLTPLLKLHGSSNFLCRLPFGISQIGESFDCERFIEGAETFIAKSTAEIHAWCKDSNNSQLSPVLAVYEKGKRVPINSSLVEQIQQEFRGAVDRASLLVIIGTNYIPEDTHIWSTLEATSARKLIVDPYPNRLRDWAIKTRGETTIIEGGFNNHVLPISSFIRDHLKKTASASCDHA